MSFLEVFVMSLIPTFEGRYAVVYGIQRGYGIFESIMAAILGVIILSLVLPYALPYIDKIMELLMSTPLGKISKLYIYYLERTRKKASPYVKKWGFLGLVVFVAIPLPGTGIWTGSLAAYVLGIDKKSTIPALLIGGLLSLAITTLILSG